MHSLLFPLLQTYLLLVHETLQMELLRTAPFLHGQLTGLTMPHQLYQSNQQLLTAPLKILISLFCATSKSSVFIFRRSSSPIALFAVQLSLGFDSDHAFLSNENKTEIRLPEFMGCKMYFL